MHSFAFTLKTENAEGHDINPRSYLVIWIIAHQETDILKQIITYIQWLIFRKL